MPPLPPPQNPLPRLVVYHQTHHTPDGTQPISVLPLITQPGISLTHLILAAIHINEEPSALTLNDQHPSHPRFQTLWAEIRVLQASGVAVLGMLGGAAKGSYERLDGSDEQFERYYCPLRDMIRERSLDGLDLDVEEDMSLAGIIRLIHRLRTDFGKDFILTMAPVAAALLWPSKNLSGFDYEALEVMAGKDISWYNAQFYNGWGDLSNPLIYDMIIQKGWPPNKVVVGMLTSPSNGRGFLPWNPVAELLTVIRGRHGQFGGVMGWEYFNSMPGGVERPWEWARQMTSVLRGSFTSNDAPQPLPEGKPQVKEVDADEPNGKEAEVPAAFEYHSDGSG